MSTALADAERSIDSAIADFKSGLDTLAHLSENQKRAVVKAAGALAKQCMRIQCSMDQRLIRETLGE